MKAVISKENEISLPLEIAEHLGIEEGDVVTFQKIEGAVQMRKQQIAGGYKEQIRLLHFLMIQVKSVALLGPVNRKEDLLADIISYHHYRHVLIQGREKQIADLFERSNIIVSDSFHGEEGRQEAAFYLPDKIELPNRNVIEAYLRKDYAHPLVIAVPPFTQKKEDVSKYVTRMIGHIPNLIVSLEGGRIVIYTPVKRMNDLHARLIYDEPNKRGTDE